MQRYSVERYRVYPVGEIMKYVYPGSPRIVLEGFSVYTSTQRLLTYRKETACKYCGLEARFFALEKNGNVPHLNLYGVDENEVDVMLTSDHILPRSRGGSNGVKNRQCLCERCNCEKKNNLKINEVGVYNPRQLARALKKRKLGKLKASLHNSVRRKNMDSEKREKVVKYIKQKMQEVSSMSLTQFMP